jgi:hypothetical protein
MKDLSFDHHANGRVFHISKGTDSWAVNDVTAARNAPPNVKSAGQMAKQFPSFWVAFADSREAAIEKANQAN